MIQKVLKLIEADEILYKGEKIPYYDSSAYILDVIDDLLLEGNFEKANEYLKEAIPYIKDFPIVIMLIYLSVTNFPENTLKLSNRSEFFDECKRVLELRNESEDRIKRLLGGLENQ